ncbi:hypothetical protein [Dysgonomonas sp. Marseille-P4361]|uniref:hypothetical protein n=1 Tax=Dysgonomonas sp. Marseille-P4361 TaxID=2161820 RepID=UPI000D557464|nr:hypothetical protein [Dysgonomonas sp. Marseille-P4361]
MKKLLLALMGLVLIFSLSNCSKSSKYQIVIDELNEQLPADYPGGVRIEKAELDGDVFKYYYSLSSDMEVSSEEFVSNFRDNVVSMVVNQSDLRIFRDDGMTIAFVFQNKDGSVFAEIKVTPEDYG